MKIELSVNFKLNLQSEFKPISVETNYAHKDRRLKKRRLLVRERDKYIELPGNPIFSQLCHQHQRQDGVCHPHGNSQGNSLPKSRKRKIIYHLLLLAAKT